MTISSNRFLLDDAQLAFSLYHLKKTEEAAICLRRLLSACPKDGETLKLQSERHNFYLFKIIM